MEKELGMRKNVWTIVRVAFSGLQALFRLFGFRCALPHLRATSMLDGNVCHS